MRTRSYKTRLGVLAWVWVAAAVVAGVFYAVILSPARAHHQQLVQTLAEEKGRLDWVAAATRPEALAELTEQVKALETRAGDFSYTREGLAELAFSVGRLAADQKVANVRVKTQETRGATDERVAERRLEIECNGGFHEFAGLLNAFERHRPVLFVDTLSIQRPTSAGEKLNTSMTVTVLVDTPGQVQSPSTRK